MNIKELERLERLERLDRLENNASNALAAYLATPLDAATIVPIYAKYKDAYAALSYARCFNLDNNK